MLHPGYDLQIYSIFCYTLYILRNEYLKNIKLNISRL